MLNKLIISIALMFSYCSVLAEPLSSSIDHLTVYTAKKIITMEPSMPEAKAVAVAKGRIVA